MHEHIHEHTCWTCCLPYPWPSLSHPPVLLDSCFKKLSYVYEHFTCTYISALLTCLVPEGVREGIRSKVTGGWESNAMLWLLRIKSGSSGQQSAFSWLPLFWQRRGNICVLIIYISQMSIEVEHFFKYSLTICTFFKKNFFIDSLRILHHASWSLSSSCLPTTSLLPSALAISPPKKQNLKVKQQQQKN